MTKKLDPLPDHQIDECPDCKVPLETGFGFAGGGYGPYGYCPKCNLICWKAVYDDDEQDI